MIGTDHQAGIIRGYIVATRGVSTDGRCEFDDVSLGALVELGNAVAGGVTNRLAHPAESNRFKPPTLGTSQNFRRDGEHVRADLHTRGEHAEWMLGMAEHHHEHIGASVDVRWDAEPQPRLGRKWRPPLARITNLNAVDIVDNPAINESFFGAKQLPREMSLTKENESMSTNVSEFEFAKACAFKRLKDEYPTLDHNALDEMAADVANREAVAASGVEDIVAVHDFGKVS